MVVGEGVKGFSCTGHVQVIGSSKMVRPEEEITEIRLRVRSPMGPVSHLKFPRAGHIFILNIGSGPNCMVRDECLANMHASIELQKFSAYVAAHDSTAGVIVNGDRVHGKASLREGDEVRCGDLLMHVYFGHPGIEAKGKRSDEEFCPTCRAPWGARPSCKEHSHWVAYTEIIERDRADLRVLLVPLEAMKKELDMRGDRCRRCGRKDVRLIWCQGCLENLDGRLGRSDDSAQ